MALQTWLLTRNCEIGIYSNSGAATFSTHTNYIPFIKPHAAAANIAPNGQ